MVFLWKKKKDIKDADFQKIKKDLNNIFDKADLF